MGARKGSRSIRRKVCHVHLLPIMSGPQHSTIELFKQLPSEAYELDVVMAAPGEFQERLEALGVRVHCLRHLVRGISPLYDARSLVELTRLFRQEAYDLVHTHSSKTGFLGRLAARLAGTRAIVHHVRGFAFHEFSTTSNRIAFAAIEAIGARLCDRVIFVNDEERLWAARKGVVPEERSCTVYNGADLRVYCPAERQRLRSSARVAFGLGPEHSVIAFLGRLWEQKHPQALVPTLVELLRQFPQLDPVLLIAGDGPLRGEVIRMAKLSGVEERVRLLGWRNDVPVVMSAADVVYLPSLWEGLPRTLIEAAAFGIPAVATDVKGNREVIVEQETGFLVPPNDVASAASALGTILTSSEKRLAMEASAAQRGRLLYDSRETARKIERIYHELLD
jgi:glycosyltransferase involved in cell wall biosynthesis